jgi:FkbM family methyltransferase
MNLWDMHKLGRIPWAKKLAKRLISLYLRDGVTRSILTGPLRGYRWRCHAEQQFWFALGAYESETTAWLIANLRPGDTFLDVGANFGYFSLLASKYVGPTGRVFAFEPVASFADNIVEQLHLNDVLNGTVERLALCDRCAELEFVQEQNGANSHLASLKIEHAQSSPVAKVRVQGLTLDAYIARNDVNPDVIKIDVEGAEVDVLKGANYLMETIRPRMIISTHGRQLKKKCRELLEDRNYRVEPLEGFTHELIASPLNDGSGRVL